MKPQKRRRILAGGMGLLLVALLLFLWNGTAGNPISAQIATKKVTAYVKETYPNAGFAVAKAHYNFKTGGYSCFVTSPTSEDTAFSVEYHRGKIRDDYEYEVANCFSTYRRLDRELDSLVEKIVGEQFPHKVNLLLGSMRGEEDMSRTLTLDMPFDRYNLPLPVEVTLWVDTEDISYSQAARLLLELDSIFQREKLTVDRYTIRLSDVVEYDENGNPVYDHQREEIHIIEFPAGRLAEKNLPQVLEEHQVQWEKEADSWKKNLPEKRE